MRIDPHVHCRSRKEKHKATVENTLDIAASQGIDTIFAMPNTNPPIIGWKDVNEYFQEVPKEHLVKLYIYVGLTADPTQIIAVSLYKEDPRVIGLKLFAGRSVGNLSVVEEKDQRTVYETLTRVGYRGVIAVHCEKEAFLKPELWNPSRVITHSLARPKSAEIESVKDQIRFAQETGFQGTLHICHVSCPESVEIINKARKSIRITCGVTPHHIMWTSDKLRDSHGALYKVNPPLRQKNDVEGLRKCLQDGKIDWIETDHAPHALGEKLHGPYPSGYPSLHLYRHFVERVLPDLDISPEQIERLTYTNIIEIFHDKL